MTFKHSYADYRSGAVSHHDYYSQFITTAFEKVALEAAKYDTIQKRDMVLSGYHTAHPNSSIKTMTFALHDRFPKITAALRESGNTASLSDYTCIAAAAVKNNGGDWSGTFR